MFSLKFNRSDYRLIAIFFAIMAIWLVLKFWTEDYVLNQILFDVPIIILKTLAALFIVRWLAQKFMVEKQYYALFIILSIVALVITGFVDMLRDYLGSGRTIDDLPKIGYVLVHSFYYSSADLALPFLVILFKKYFENQAQLAKANEQKKETELKLLRSQLSPHFLFNNLNTLDALIDSNPDQAKEYIARLSSIYRYLIRTKDDDIVLLEAEVTMAKDYFYLIKTRFGKAYSFEIERIENVFANAYLPTGALQTTLENVVKHNKIIQGKPIHTSLKLNKNSIILKNTKSSLTLTKKDSFGTGLKNLKERYELLLNKTIIINETATCFELTLPIVYLTHPDN